VSNRRKICVVVTARPSYSRIKSCLAAIVAHPGLELQLVVSASALLDKYGHTLRDIERDGFAIAARVYIVFEGENPATMAKTTGLGLLELSTVFDNLRPDVVVTIADRYETIATAIAASYMNIPVVHVQGGEITGSIDEKVRHAVTKLSDCHFTSTKKAAERVLLMGEEPSKVFVTGCPSIDLAADVLKSPAMDFDPFERYVGVGAPTDIRQGYVVVLQHPVTTEYEHARAQIDETLHAMAGCNFPVLWFWPNVDAGADGTSRGIRAFREIQQPSNFHFFKNMGSTDFLRLLCNSRGIVGNSSVAIRECAFLGVPAVNIGTRQSGRERGRNVIDVGYNRMEITTAVETHFRNGKAPLDAIYGDGQAGTRMAALLAELSFTTIKKLTY
jgi:UDP-hydrolysing UDP-N-acetyl-D-glucosamine 2-epimerase